MRTPGGRSPRVKILLWAVAVLATVSLIVGAAAVRVASSAQRLEEAEDLLDQAALALEERRLADARAALAEAETIVVRANNGLYSPIEVQLADSLPVIRDNLDSLRDSVALATSIIHGGRQILGESVPLESAEGRLEVSLSDGTIPLEAVRGALREIEALSVQLPTQPLDEDSPFILEQTERLRDAVYAEAIERRAQLDVLREGLKLLLELAGSDGPRRYVLAVANTAEMRGAGGMILNYGVLEGRDGVIDLTEFGRVDELFLEEPVPPESVELPDDFTSRWSGFEPTRLWRSANVAADFTLAAPILEALYEHAAFERTDGVVQVDPKGLAAILTGVGPVVVPELGEVNADNVERLVLNEAYRRFPGVEERSDVLGDVAEAAFRRLVDGEFQSLRPLAEAVAKAVDGRHILFHSRSPSVASSGAFFSASGELPAADHLDWTHLTVQNISANKLDYYLDTALHLTGERRDGRIGHLQAELVITNTAPPGATEPGYIFGPYNDLQRAGLYRGLVTLYLPNGTSLVDHGGGPLRSEPITQTEGGRTLVSFLVDVAAGEARRVVLDLQLAPVAASVPYDLTLVPSPRVRPTTVTVEVETSAGPLTAERSLDRTYVLRPGGRP